MFVAITTTVALVITRICVSVGFRLGIVDHPNARKRHRSVTPLTGGASVFLTIVFGVAFLGVTPFTNEMLLIAAAIFAVGVFDDIRHINPWIRLAIQYIAGICLATIGGIVILDVGNLLGFGNIHLLWLSIPLTALSVAGLSYACNMIDGIDGLSGSLIILPLALLYGLAAGADVEGADFLLLMAIPIAVFLLFNLGPDNRYIPRVFLGDGGSIMLGFLLTASLIYFSQGENAIIRPVTALWFVTVPLMDMLATMLRRSRSGLDLMKADRRHIHYTLTDHGLTARQTLTLLVGYSLLMALLGLMLEAVPPYISLAAYFLVFVLHCVAVVSLERRGESPSS